MNEGTEAPSSLLLDIQVIPTSPATFLPRFTKGSGRLSTRDA